MKYLLLTIALLLPLSANASYPWLHVETGPTWEPIEYGYRWGPGYKWR